MAALYDLLIANTTIVDGTGAAARPGWVGIAGERIAAIGAPTPAGETMSQAARVIDGSGLVTCPGFVDPHTHADTTILTCPLAENLAMQGVTTFAGGNCGFSMAPVPDVTRFHDMLELWGLHPQVNWATFGEWLSRVETEGLALNYIPLVGHNTVRRAVLGSDFRRRASTVETTQMAVLIEEAMRSGAFGLSVGLDASWEGHFAGVEEIITLARVARRHGGLFAPHTRHHQNQWPAANPDEYGYGIFHAPTGEIITGRYHGLLEAVEIARQAHRIPLHIAHLTPAYLIPQPHPTFLDEAAARATLADIVDRARDEGLSVTFNVVAWSQTVGSRAPISDSFLGRQPLLPDWLRSLSREEFAEQLKSKPFRERVKQVVYSGKFKFGMLHPLSDPYWMDCYRILECQNSGYVGWTVGELARARRPGHIIEAVYDEALAVVFDILVEDPGASWALIIDKREHGALPTFLQHPAGMPCSDVQAFAAGQPAGGSPRALYGYGGAPIAYGLFPHYLRLFVKELGALTLEEAVRKATSVPALEVFGLRDRGALKVGAYADIVMFNLDTLQEGNDFLNPARPPQGIEHVLVNGQVIYERLQHIGARPGKVLRHAGG